MKNELCIFFALVIIWINFANGMTDEQLVLYNQLSDPLKTFVDDYRALPKEQQEKISVTRWGYIVDGSINELTTKYGSDISSWLDRHVYFEQFGSFIVLIDTIQKKDKNNPSS